MKPKIVLIGAGNFGKNHLRNLLKFDKKKKIELIGVIDSDRNTLTKIKNEYDLNTSNNYREFFEQADAFDVVTPASTHHKIVNELLRKSKHVFVEKPMALESKKAELLVKLARKNNSVLQVGLIFRYNNAIKYIKNRIKQKNKFPYYIHGKFLQTTTPKSDVGALFNFLHHYDILDNILNVKPSQVFAISNLDKKFGKTLREVNADVILNYNKTNAFLSLGWVPIGKMRTLELYSKNEYIFCDLLNQNIIIKQINGKKDKIVLKHEEPLSLELNEFIDCIKNKKLKPKATGEIGHRIVKIAETATKSLKSERYMKFDWS